MKPFLIIAANVLLASAAPAFQKKETDLQTSIQDLMGFLLTQLELVVWETGVCNNTYEQVAHYANEIIAFGDEIDETLLSISKDLAAEAVAMIETGPCYLHDTDAIPGGQLADRYLRAAMTLWYDQYELVLNGESQVVGNVSKSETLTLHEGDYQDFEVFSDCSEEFCGDMLVVPAGEYTMGGTEEEHIALNVDDYRVAWESPRHNVSIGRKFAVSIKEVTVGNYAAFVEDTNRTTAPGCLGFPTFTDLTVDNFTMYHQDTDWSNPGFEQTDDHPVVCVTRSDGEDYAKWLSKKTGQRYRLPSEAEFEYYARAGVETAFFWGSDENDACTHAAVYDLDTDEGTGYEFTHVNCHDNSVYANVVGSYIPNNWGIYDVTGNAREWVADYWIDSYETGPFTEEARLQGGVRQFPLLRGGAWDYMPQNIRLSYRSSYYTLYMRSNMWGFRVVRDI